MNLKYRMVLDEKTNAEYFLTEMHGKALLNHSLLNKGTAFTLEERESLKLLGKLPYRIESLEEQLSRAKDQFNHYTSTLQKYIYLSALHDKNEILFYKFLLENLSETLPLIYTPGVSEAVQAFSKEFRQARGIYLAYPDKDKINEVFDNRTNENIELLVVTDGERILGIGDQGIGGIDIPIAKLVVYCLCGVHPYKTLPVMLDVGTDNPTLLNDPLYLGWRHSRLKGKEYDDFIALFVQTVKEKFPNSFLHWEDFGQKNARRILETYRKQHCTFNDDMQGTGVVALAALLRAMQISQLPMEQHRIVVFGAGTAGVGISDQLFNALCRHGVDPNVARRQFWLIDKNGLIQENDELTVFQRPYARPASENHIWEKDVSFNAVVNTIKPTILIGCSAIFGAFQKEIVECMAAHTSHPIIFPLSNPNSHCEAHPFDLLRWSKGRALVATGSPYEAVQLDGVTYSIAQSNNAFSFPGIGLGVLASRAQEVTDNMLWAGTEAICEYTALQSSTQLLPNIENIPELAQRVAFAVAKQAQVDGMARAEFAQDYETFVKENVWRPYYRPIVKESKRKPTLQDTFSRLSFANLRRWLFKEN